jgi:hypothetical protein
MESNRSSISDDDDDDDDCKSASSSHRKFEIWEILFFFSFSQNTQKLTFNKTNTNNFLLGTDVERVRDGVRNVRDRFVRRGVRKGDLCESALRAGVERSVFE